MREAPPPWAPRPNGTCSQSATRWTAPARTSPLSQVFYEGGMFSCPFGLDVDGIVRVGDRLASINVAPGTMRVIPGIRFLITSLVPTFVPQT